MRREHAVSRSGDLRTGMRVRDIVALSLFVCPILVNAHAPQVQYTIGHAISTIPVATPTIIPNPLRPTRYFFAYGRPRAYGFGDFNGDGLADIVVAPTYYDQLPERPVEILLNNGNGTFRDGTAELLNGGPVLSGNVNAVVVADFNEDGRPDVFLLDTGLELNQPRFPGHRLGLLLSQPEGSLVDASDRIAPNDVVFNHAGVVTDINGDGHLDLIVTRLGVPGLHEADGSLLFLGDGKGNFSATTVGLPPEIAYFPWTSVDFTKDRQSSGCSAAADLDGDGRVDLITGTYSYADPLTGLRTLRFHQQQPDGKFLERSRVEIPVAIRDVGYSTANRTNANDGLGCAQLVAGDLFGSGRPDIVVLWEGSNKSYIELLRNDGNFAFSDMTVESLGDYAITDTDFPLAGYHLLDLNDDGALDIVGLSFGETADGLTRGSFSLLNDGHGKFSKWLPQGASASLSSAQIEAILGCSWCPFTPLVFDANGDKHPDVVLINQNELVTVDPIQTSTLKLATLFAQPSRDVNYGGLWWNPLESGWGLNVAHQADIIFATWFTYDMTGVGRWLSMTANEKAQGSYTGTVVQTQGPSYSAATFEPSHIVTTAVGAATLTFNDANNASFAYQVNGIRQTKQVTRQVFGKLPTCLFGDQADLARATNYQDLWWVPGGAESGWGVNLTQQGDTIFATWFTYDTNGAPMWLSATAPKTGPGMYTGTLVRTTGPAFNATPFLPQQVRYTPVGTLSLAFSDGNSATFGYTVVLPGEASVTQTKAITREVFRPPGTVCQ